VVLLLLEDLFQVLLKRSSEWLARSWREESRSLFLRQWWRLMAVRSNAVGASRLARSAMAASRNKRN
jgi:hypothetical protein